LRRRKNRLEPRDRPDSFLYFGTGGAGGAAATAGPAEKRPIDLGGTDEAAQTEARHPSLRYPDPDFGEGPAGARTGGNY
jgi:hypothetical protein